MLIHAIKSKGMIFNGPLPARAPRLTVNSTVIDWVKEYCYVGMFFCSTDRYIFARHIDQRTANARKAANASLCLESYVGRVPAWVLRTLYMAMVDPHLIFGCKVALDVEASLTLPLQKLQHAYIRRLLGLNKRSATSVLFTETGLWPITYRRAQLALRYLMYIIRDKPALPLAALDEAYLLASSGHASWFSDLYYMLRSLPIPIPLDLSSKPTIASVSELLLQLESTLRMHLDTTIENSPKFVLIHGRLDYSSKSRRLVHNALAFRNYLKVQIFEHRRALARLVASDHPLAVEQLRRVSTTRRVPRESRTCRFCAISGTIESECHVLLNCTDRRLTDLRDKFMDDALATCPALVQHRRTTTDLGFLRALLSRDATIDRLGAYVHEVFMLCAEVPMLIPDVGTAP